VHIEAEAHKIAPKIEHEKVPSAGALPARRVKRIVSEAKQQNSLRPHINNFELSVRR
jgi:hypothetical protein